MIACDRARVATEFGFKAKWPMNLAYGRRASRNCMIAYDQARVAIDLGLKGNNNNNNNLMLISRKFTFIYDQVFRVCENCISQYIIA
jgi:hypothetical protein